jgi:aspartyl-tRNA(Asn)/glutamyl-tRNA(Gln) amidotransferase subunit B
MVCGVETHAELATRTKIFCGCSTEFGGEPNTHICPVCLGLPGTLPVLNRRVVDLAITAGLALQCEISGFSKFDRKNYFYPDMPKNYQTSQYDLPICQHGALEIETTAGKKTIGITRAHMEEDAGKLLHSGDTIMISTGSLVDYNRAGVPLLEIVSEPDMRSVEEVLAYLESLVRILDYTGVSDCKLEQGSVRFDVNLSLRPVGSAVLGTRTETKNLNSFASVRRCLEYERARQEEVLSEGGTVRQETRTWDDARGITLSLRTKEEAEDYRYFPEPDLMPLEISAAWVESLRQTLPELPDAKRDRYVSLGLSDYDAAVIVANRSLASYYDEALSSRPDPKLLANWLTSELSGLLKTKNITLDESLVRPSLLAALVKMIEQGEVSGKIGKTILEEMSVTGKEPQVIAQERGLKQISDKSELETVIAAVLTAQEKSVADYHNGKEQALGFLVGQVMKATKGQANPALVNELLREKLAERS